MSKYTAVIGSGAWGTALANLVSENCDRVVIFAREEKVINSINSHKENKLYLPSIKLNNNISAAPMDDMGSYNFDNVVWTVPTQFSREVAKKYSSILKGKDIINASKGIEISTGKPVITALEEEIKANFSIISGPTFANEVASKLPTAASIASFQEDNNIKWQKMLSTGYFRVYSSDDIMGVQLGGALKNIIAIATGICDGLNFGYNARAALITRGLAEITRFGHLYGAKRETFLGLSGIGDLVLTTTSDNSRNRKVGLALAKGKSYSELSKESNTVAEGVYTAKAVHIVAAKNNVTMPITDEIYNIIFENKPIKDSFEDLMLRPSNKKELD